MNPPSGEPLYQVVYPENVRAILKDQARQAGIRGLGQAFLEALQRLDKRLHQGPHELGEALFNLPEAKLEIRLAADTLLALTWGVHKEKPLVFVRQTFLLG